MAWTKRTLCLRRGAAFLAATVSNATTAMACVPDNAIVKLGRAKAFISSDYCKGCGLCSAECPCSAIEMVPETV